MRRLKPRIAGENVADSAPLVGITKNPVDGMRTITNRQRGNTGTG
ncbi:hypothetical protein ABID26_004057 [Mesorhizobium shonense]|uniref:Uncharacterized protein n=1 Tax=Mesorhizobium shonense TaxID=1209948 RepID=A0ABV2HVM4_9HYPH